MKRRDFFKTLATAVAGFAILPAATTYARRWKWQAKEWVIVPNPAWETAEYEVRFIDMPPIYDQGIPIGWPGDGCRRITAEILKRESKYGWTPRYEKRGDLYVLVPGYKEIS